MMSEYQCQDDNTYDLLGELLLEREAKALLTEIEEETVHGKTSEMEAFFTQYDKHNLKRIKRYFRNQKIKHFFSKLLHYEKNP